MQFGKRIRLVFISKSKHTVRSCTTWAWASLSPVAILPRRTSKEITKYSKNLPIAWSLKYVLNAPEKSLDLMGMFMLWTLQR